MRPSTLGWLTALVGLVLDQASKYGLLYGVRLGETGPIPLAPFAELRLIWNYGISYGLLRQHSELGQWLLVGVAVVASVALAVWLTRVRGALVAVAVGLILAGAIGNGFDRAIHGAVIDFAHLFLPDRSYSWYVFNLADVWIVAGVVGLLYDSVVVGRKDATN